MHNQNRESITWPTVTARQRVVPLMVPLTHNGLLIAQSIALIAAKRHSGADGEIVPVPFSIHRDPWI